MAAYTTYIAVVVAIVAIPSCMAAVGASIIIARGLEKKKKKRRKQKEEDRGSEGFDTQSGRMGYMHFFLI